ncbi:sensor histidine kinase [Gordonia sp. NB41Y]|uniref:ATP-binding protein n=1 Tax=Gordonia sp. NB41Y TaxID=875808 RepID=UPI0006B179D0|nr:sensor histidine kinase [Gordonia sp. NB41Y]EMP12311.2 histidine kinase [Gordonia sp. NB41Y]WLP91722.1 sensor histidine kinase [Gordonia sp. NB41Y]
MSRTPASWWTPWRNPRWAFIALWSLFLAYPLAATITSDAPAAAKITTYVLLGAFAGVYLFASVYVLSGRPGGNPWGIAVFAVLVALVLGLMPLIGQDAFGAAPFLMVVAALTFPMIWALTVMAAVLIASIAIPELAGWGADVSVVVILATVGLTLLGVRVATARETERELAEQRRRDLDAQLAVVAERERVARDVHDILGHSLTVITIKSELAGRLVDLDPARAKTEITEVNQLARQALAEVRSTVGRLRTPELPDVIAGAESALRAAGIEACLPDPHRHTDHGTLFAWVLREAVTNVVRHSGATRCEVTLDDDSITVHDNGTGMDPAFLGNGLRGLTERVEAAGGTLRIDSGADGTTLVAQIRPRTPIRSDDAR